MPRRRRTVAYETSYGGCQSFPTLAASVSSESACGLYDEDAILATPLTVPADYPSGPSDWASAWVGTYALTSGSACSSRGFTDGVQAYSAEKRPCCGATVKVERMHNTAYVTGADIHGVV
jgi:hypothetical protein